MKRKFIDQQITESILPNSEIPSIYFWGNRYLTRKPLMICHLFQVAYISARPVKADVRENHMSQKGVCKHSGVVCLTATYDFKTALNK